MLEPQMLLLDEPLSNLDAKLGVSCAEELMSLQQRLGMTFAYGTRARLPTWMDR